MRIQKTILDSLKKQAKIAEKVSSKTKKFVSKTSKNISDKVEFINNPNLDDLVKATDPTSAVGKGSPAVAVDDEFISNVSKVNKGKVKITDDVSLSKDHLNSQRINTKAEKETGALLASIKVGLQHNDADKIVDYINDIIPGINIKADDLTDLGKLKKTIKEENKRSKAIQEMEGLYYELNDHIGDKAFSKLLKSHEALDEKGLIDYSKLNSKGLVSLHNEVESYTLVARNNLFKEYKGPPLNSWTTRGTTISEKIDNLAYMTEKMGLKHVSQKYQSLYEKIKQDMVWHSQFQQLTSKTVNKIKKLDEAKQYALQKYIDALDPNVEKMTDVIDKYVTKDLGGGISQKIRVDENALKYAQETFNVKFSVEDIELANVILNTNTSLRRNYLHSKNGGVNRVSFPHNYYDAIKKGWGNDLIPENRVNKIRGGNDWGRNYFPRIYKDEAIERFKKDKEHVLNPYFNLQSSTEKINHDASRRLNYLPDIDDLILPSEALKRYWQNESVKGTKNIWKKDLNEAANLSSINLAYGSMDSTFLSKNFSRYKNDYFTLAKLLNDHIDDAFLFAKKSDNLLVKIYQFAVDASTASALTGAKFLISNVFQAAFIGTGYVKLSEQLFSVNKYAFKTVGHLFKPKDINNAKENIFRRALTNSQKFSIDNYFEKNHPDLLNKTTFVEDSFAKNSLDFINTAAQASDTVSRLPFILSAHDSIERIYNKYKSRLLKKGYNTNAEISKMIKEIKADSFGYIDMKTTIKNIRKIQNATSKEAIEKAEREFLADTSEIIVNKVLFNYNQFNRAALLDKAKQNPFTASAARFMSFPFYAQTMYNDAVRQAKSGNPEMMKRLLTTSVLYTLALSYVAGQDDDNFVSEMSSYMIGRVPVLGHALSLATLPARAIGGIAVPTIASIAWLIAKPLDMVTDLFGSEKDPFDFAERETRRLAKQNPAWKLVERIYDSLEDARDLMEEPLENENTDNIL